MMQIYIIQIQSCDERDFDSVSVHVNEEELKEDIRSMIAEYIDDFTIDNKVLSEDEVADYLKDFDLDELQKIWDEHHGDDWSLTHWTTTIEIPCLRTVS